MQTQKQLIDGYKRILEIIADQSENVYMRMGRIRAVAEFSLEIPFEPVINLTEKESIALYDFQEHE